MPAATTSTGTPTPSAGSTETPTKSGIDGAGQPAATATDRGWDGWPTPPTQEYLIPGMGKVPVSSTVHFQTVAMTAMGDDISAEQLRELRSRLLFAAQGRPNRRWALDNTGRVTVTTVPVQDAQFEESQLAACRT